MSAIFVKGDLFNREDLDALAHGCNCAGVVGKGIALIFRSVFPEMYKECRRRCRNSTFKLGEVFEWRADGITVFNLGTRRTWKAKATLSAVRDSVSRMLRLAEVAGIHRVGIPRIGSGLGGLDWALVRATLEELGHQADVELVVFEEFVKTPSSV